MASNEEVINICNRLLNEKPYSVTQLNVIYDEIKLVCEKFLQAIDDLELYKKALDKACLLKESEKND